VTRIAARFFRGMKAAVPIWVAFVPSSVAWGISAQAHGLTIAEVVALSAWVYSGPAQFAVLLPLAEGQPPLQVLFTGSLMNLRFLPMSMALAPFFRGVNRLPLILASQVISASSFVVPYLHFQREQDAAKRAAEDVRLDGRSNLAFFLGVGGTSFAVWLCGSVAGFTVARGLPQGIDEALKFILPGYFAALLVAEVKGWTAPAICLLSLVAAIPGALVSPGWGWIVTATAVAVAGWGVEEWKLHASKPS
jgi:predicted branched-subunit amino acid permease